MTNKRKIKLFKKLQKVYSYKNEKMLEKEMIKRRKEMKKLTYRSFRRKLKFVMGRMLQDLASYYDNRLNRIY